MTDEIKKCNKKAPPCPETKGCCCEFWGVGEPAQGDPSALIGLLCGYLVEYEETGDNCFFTDKELAYKRQAEWIACGLLGSKVTELYKQGAYNVRR